jgi:hypothetical protein
MVDDEIITWLDFISGNNHFALNIVFFSHGQTPAAMRRKGLRSLVINLHYKLK